eukprot:gene20512-40309_t
MAIDEANKSFGIVAPFQGDPFVGHLSTPVTTSNLTKSYLSLLPAYKAGLSPLLRGINIGFVHGYFLLGPFVKLGPLRDSQGESKQSSVDFLNAKGWREFTSGFIVGGFGGAGI